MKIPLPIMWWPFSQRAVAAISYTVTAASEPMILVVQSELFANEELPVTGGDPRVEAALARPLLHSLRGTGLRMAASMDHEVTGRTGTETHTTSSDDLARTTVVCRLAPGRKIRIVKYSAYSLGDLVDCRPDVDLSRAR